MTAALGTAVYLQRQHQNEVEVAVTRLTKLVGDSDWDGAQKFIDQLAADSPRVHEEPPIRNLADEVQKHLRNEDDRKRTFLAAAEAVRKSVDEQMPDRDALARAAKLAMTEDEKETVHKLETNVAKLDQAVVAKADQDFLGPLKELKEKADAVEKDLDDKPDSCRKRSPG